MRIRFTRDGEVIRESTFILKDDLPAMNEVITLPGSRKKHKVVTIAKKFGAVRGSSRLRVREIEFILGPAPRVK